MGSHMATEVQRIQIEIFRGFIEDYDSNDLYLVSCLEPPKFIPNGSVESKLA